MFIEKKSKCESNLVIQRDPDLIKLDMFCQILGDI